MENKVSVTNKGVDSAGIPKDYQSAIAEYIWNGFDAGASAIEIEFDTNAIDTINSLTIHDNGDGINYDTLSNTFGNFLDSVKNVSYQRSSYTHGNKGKGRFSFAAFAGKAVWSTVYKDEASNKLLEYDISITKNKKEVYKDENKVISKKKHTGTTVEFQDLFGVTSYSFSNDDFKQALGREFGWFLLLNKDRNSYIKINGESLSYDGLIAESEIENLSIKDLDGKANQFKVTYVRWKEKIGDKFYFYLLNSDKKEVAKELTSFNNNAMNFFHSIYVESDFFNAFNANDNVQGYTLFESTKSNPIYKALMTRLQELVKEKQKLFARGEAAEELIYRYEREGVIPKFKANKYDQEKRKDLIDVVKGLFCLEPKLFQGLNREQQKINIGLINLLLDSDERNNILEIISQIVNLSPEDRSEFANLLRKTTISKIARTINLIENRFKVVELLKSLVYDLKSFTNERDHIQNAVEENYWLFGEQYHLVSANEGFDKMLSRYIDLLSQTTTGKSKKAKIASEDKNRRPDIFLCRKHSVPDVLDDQLEMEENIIVELKRPTVDISKEQVRQVEDYLDIIINEDQFNSQKRFWKFYVVSNRIDKSVKSEYEAVKNLGKRYLVKALNNYEIYALTWDDVFMNFKLKHEYLIDKLDFDRNAIMEELKTKGINLSVDGSKEVTTKVIEIGAIVSA
jgi:hypothetical protein